MGNRLVQRLALAAVAAAALAISAAQAAERIGVRAWAHPGYGRIVFDWPRVVAHEARLEAGVLRISFAEPMTAGFAAVMRNLEGYVSDIALDAAGKTVTARLKGSYRLRAFTSGSKVVVDLLRDNEVAAREKGKKAEEQKARALAPVMSRAAAPALRPPMKLVRPPAPPAIGGPGRTPAPAPDSRAVARPAPVALPIRVDRRPEFGRLVFEWPSKTGFTVNRRGQKVTIQFDAPAQVDTGALQRSLPRQIEAAAVRPSAAGLALELNVPADAQLRYFHSGSHVMFDVVTRIEQSRAEPGTPAAPPSRAAGGQDEAPAAADTRKLPPPQLVSVEAEREGVQATISFNWREAVNAAVFKRGTVLWVVFDRRARLDLAAVRIVGRSLFETVEQQQASSDISVVRLPMTMAYETAVRRKGTIWIVEIGPVLPADAEELPLQIERRHGEGTSVLVGASKAAPVIPLVDPDIGDTIFVVPSGAPGGVMPALRRFPEFELLESANGVAVRPLDERVRVASSAEGVRIFRTGGLTVSDPLVFAKASKDGVEKAPKLLDFSAWQYGPAEDFQKIEHELLQYVTEPGGLKRSAARLGLARFYVAHGMAAEALGVIGAMLREDPAMLRDAGVRALRGVARCLVGHYADAAADLQHPTLRDELQVNPWRAAIAVARGDWRRAHRLFEGTDQIFNAYPTRFAMHFGLLATEAALAVGDLDAAAIRLNVLDATPATGAQLDYAAYLRGHLLKKQGEVEKAIELWTAVIAMGDRPSRAKASLALVNAQLETSTITSPAAIERLEQLRFAWRDDVFEFDLLHRLGQLYAESKDFRNALITLRQAATYFKDIEGAGALVDEMRTLFKKFYLDGDADALPPVVALGLFNEFRELTPSGEEGDLMYRKLADRLVSVDLLAEAAELLEHQVQFRLEGEARLRVATRLAEIRLMNDDPAAALTALATDVKGKVPEDLADRRLRLKARALTENGDLQQALALLGDNRTDEGQLLKAQILWRSGEWQQAAHTLARITAPFHEDTLGTRETELLLRRAVALSLAGDQPGIDYLRERFGPAMAKTGRAAAFDAVVGRKPVDTEDYAVLARQAAELDTFTAFMKKSDAGAPPVTVPDVPPQSAAIN